MTNIGLVVISACKLMNTHEDGADAGTIQVQRQFDAVGRRYVRMTRRLLANKRLCPAVVSEAVLRQEMERWKRGHLDCAIQLARFLDLDARVVADVLCLYRAAIKRGWVSRLG